MASIKITQRTISGLEANGKRQFVRDTALVGFGIEVSAKGKASYFVETRLKGGGRTVRTHLGNVDHLPLDDAKQEAKKLLLDAKRGTDIRFRHEDDEPTPETLTAAIREFTVAKRHTLAASTLSDYNKTFLNCLPDWKDLPTKQLTKSMVKSKYLELLTTKSAAYTNKVFRNLSAILNFHGIEPNPCNILRDKRLRVSTQGRARFLSAREIYNILQYHYTFRPKVTSILLFYMLTGCRRSEALSLTWADIHDGKVFLRNTKNGQVHFVPLVGMLETIVGDRKKDTISVFGFTDSTLRSSLIKFQKQPEIRDDWTIHDLRRTFSEHLNLIGYAETDIAVANNQSSSSVTRGHYLRGQLAKEALLTRMYRDLQQQYDYYHREPDGPVQRVPKGWVPEDMKIDDSMTEADGREYDHDTDSETRKIF
jgi:integrase